MNIHITSNINIFCITYFKGPALECFRDIFLKKYVQHLKSVPTSNVLKTGLEYMNMFTETKKLCKNQMFFCCLTDQRFSMPIQCTDRTAEAETPFSSALRSAVDIPLPPTSLASRGASPEDRDLVDSLTKLSVKFPPSADSEYDFLNSTPERNIGLPMKRPLSGVPTAVTEEESVELPMPFVYPTFSSHSTSSSLSQESVRGPQQVRITGEGLRKLVANYQFLIGLR